MILSQQISFFFVFFLCLLEKIDAVIHSNGLLRNYKHSDPSFTIHMVSLTQRGYIQFLKYATKVPTLTDYTFCIWVTSNNLTHNQPLLSYSKHEEERLIRVWISPKGNDLNLEILQHHVTSVPMYMVENRWFHICQSWSSSQATWEIFIDGKLKSSGFVPKLRGVPIKGGGDIVVGQEYTDFDKGLDDGIEGGVFGFNFVLASTSKHPPNPIKLVSYPLRRYGDGGKRIKPQLRGGKSPHVYLQPPQMQLNLQEPLIVGNNNRGLREIRRGYPDVTSVVGVAGNAGHFGQGRAFAGFHTLNNNLNFFETKSNPLFNKRIINELGGYKKPLGLLLVELSVDCAYRKGAPLNGKGVLINWTYSIVRVYGGAILKDIPPFCRGANDGG